MKVELLKDWAKYKKGQVIEITDKTVIKKGLDTKLFKEAKVKKSKKA